MNNKFKMILFLIFLFCGCVQNQTYLKPQSFQIPSEYQNNHEWIGQKIIFLEKPESLQEYGYQNYYFSKDIWGMPKHPSYNELAKKTAEIIGCKKNPVTKLPTEFLIRIKENNKILHAQIYGGNLDNIGFLSEMENAQKYIGKSFWNKNHPTDFNADRHGYIRCEREIKNLEELVLEDIKWSFWAEGPLRFYFQTKDGIKAYWDGSYSKINDPSNISLLQPFDKNWYSQNPHELYPNWSQETWDKIENNKLFMGMTKEQAIFSWGEPEKINKSIGNWGIHKQWVYGNQYLYFENDILTSIQSY